MAGKIVADTLEHSTAGSVDTQYVVNGSAKSWNTIDGDAVSPVLDSLNVTSTTDNGNGDYTVAFASAMNNALYTITQSANRLQNNNSPIVIGTDTPATGSYTEYWWSSAFSATNPHRAWSVVHGDLA